ncbi:hypothetical protein [Luteimonas sp. MC1828]|uniref:hypothetical protein n=1 Tax=Luteimonas sp. MC1828 TaxID=2799787 RepID=UPI0018F1FF51|nr:hypothetical protein [Luteimonas sp. MC1828]MBJ7575798.1 hypothetical protein [Luteimonas sp. MC1828]
MRAFAIALRWICLVGGVAGLVVSTWAFIDPSAFPAMQGSGGAFDPPSPRWRAALGVVFSLLVIGYGSNRVHHRKLP